MTNAQHMTDAEHATVDHLLANGYAVRDIAKLMKRSRQAIYDHMKGRGLEKVRQVSRLFTAEDDATLIDMLQRKCSFIEMGEAIGRSAEAARGRLTRLGHCRTVETDVTKSNGQGLTKFAAALQGQRFEDHPATVRRSKATPKFMPDYGASQ